MTVQEAIKYLRMATDEADEYSDVYVEMCNMSIKALEEVEQYRALGTVEELKEAREKQVAKKPIRKKREHILHYECPCCGFTTLLPHCGNCGQKIDWEEGGTSE